MGPEQDYKASCTNIMRLCQIGGRRIVNLIAMNAYRRLRTSEQPLCSILWPLGKKKQLESMNESKVQRTKIRSSETSQPTYVKR